VYSFEIKTVIN